MSMYGKPHRRTTLWLGSDDGDPGGMNGYGYDVHREDQMVSISFADPRDGDSEDLEVFLLPGLFPKIRKVMDMLAPGGAPDRAYLTVALRTAIATLAGPDGRDADYNPLYSLAGAVAAYLGKDLDILIDEDFEGDDDS